MELSETIQPAFYFTVQFPDEVINPGRNPDFVFPEISGIATEKATESIEDDGLISISLTVPKSSKHGNLVLKGGLIARESILADWYLKTVQGDLSTVVKPKTILVQLKNKKDDLLFTWRFIGAYPVKWSVDEFNSTNDSIRFESIEFAYSLFRRE